MAARGQAGQPRYNTGTTSSSSAGKFLPNRAQIQENPHNLKSNNRRKDYNEADLDVHNLPSLIGTCPFMCPVEERETRERLRDLAVFERLNGDPSKSSPSLAVKKNYIYKVCQRF
ncbi:unnamed protein product [Cuscuta campestris]|uniref:SAC3/GANP/THP3 conserved domain-containing protein n=1 Tax=Cuscuta campestris TaxID=132261 RepID=A0A484N860_9ASTE|nr:unnamed protein product [Cuscuta campestris]